MNWQDKGYLLKINKYNENSSVAEFYTENFGKKIGILFGSTSRKIKNYLFIGNKFHINFNSKTDNSIGSFKIEIDKVNTPIYLDHKIKLYCILYSINIIQILSVENQKNIKIYKSLNDLFYLIKNNFNFKNYIFWELEMLKNFGYELNYNDHSNFVKKNGNKLYVSKSKENKIIPNFLVNKDIKEVDNKDLILAFELTSDFINKSILNDNNLSIPKTRHQLSKFLINL